MLSCYEILDRCHNFVVEVSREHIPARRALLASEVSQEWWDRSHYLDEQACIIGLKLQDIVIPTAKALDPQLADILCCLDEGLSRLRIALRHIGSGEIVPSSNDVVLISAGAHEARVREALEPFAELVHQANCYIDVAGDGGVAEFRSWNE